MESMGVCSTPISCASLLEASTSFLVASVAAQASIAAGSRPAYGNGVLESLITGCRAVKASCFENTSEAYGKKASFFCLAMQ